MLDGTFRIFVHVIKDTIAPTFTNADTHIHKFFALQQMFRYRLLLAVVVAALTSQSCVCLRANHTPLFRAGNRPQTMMNARALSRGFAATRLMSAAAAGGAKEKNPRVFFDVEIDAKPAGRIVFELAKDAAPKTAEVRL